MPALEAKVHDIAGTQVVVVTGEADVLSIEPLEAALKVAAAKCPARAVIDLIACSFITSVGMGALARFSRDIKAQGRVFLVLPPGHVRDVMERSRVIELFEQADSVNAAIGR